MIGVSSSKPHATGIRAAAWASGRVHLGTELSKALLQLHGCKRERGSQKRLVFYSLASNDGESTKFTRAKPTQVALPVTPRHPRPAAAQPLDGKPNHPSIHPQHQHSLALRCPVWLRLSSSPSAFFFCPTLSSCPASRILPACISQQRRSDQCARSAESCLHTTNLAATATEPPHRIVLKTLAPPQSRLTSPAVGPFPSLSFDPPSYLPSCLSATEGFAPSCRTASQNPSPSCVSLSNGRDERLRGQSGAARHVRPRPVRLRRR